MSDWIEEVKCACGCGQAPGISKRNDTINRYKKGVPREFVRGHSARLVDHTASFMQRVESQPSESCWKWHGQFDRNGYGNLTWKGKRTGAHRVSYEVHTGPIPEGMQIDHLCRNKTCVNPAHLEPVTQQENIRRAAAAKTHCRNGHEYSAVDVASKPGSARCRKCQSANNRDAYRRRTLAANEFGVTDE